jgi:hypothetical protein
VRSAEPVRNQELDRLAEKLLGESSLGAAGGGLFAHMRCLLRTSANGRPQWTCQIHARRTSIIFTPCVSSMYDARVSARMGQ